VLAYSVLRHYPCDAYDSSDCRVALAKVLKDYVFFCPTVSILQQYSDKIDSATTFGYQFNHSPSWQPPEWGAYHSSEIDFVFQNLYQINATSEPTQEEEQLSAVMAQYWTTFGKTHNPNSNNTFPVHWLPVADGEGGSSVRLEFNTPIMATMEQLPEQRCEFWKPVFESEAAGTQFDGKLSLAGYVTLLVLALCACCYCCCSACAVLFFAIRRRRRRRFYSSSLDSKTAPPAPRKVRTDSLLDHASPIDGAA